MKRLRACITLSLGVLLLGRSGFNLADEPTSFVLTTKEIGFPAIDTTITFTRTAEHTYRVRYSNPPPSPDHMMLYTGFFFCAARKLGLDSGFDRFALIPDPGSAQGDSTQGGITVFLQPGEEASKILEPRFASGTFTSIDLVGRNCPAQSDPAKR